MNLINNIIDDLQKFDTLLAFVISYLLFHHYSKSSKESFKFSIKFVLTFLFFLNLIN